MRKLVNFLLMSKMRSDFKNISLMSQTVRQYQKQRADGVRVGVARRIIARIRSVYLGYVPFSLLFLFEHLLENFRKKCEFSANQVYQLELTSENGEKYTQNSDTYNWEQHEKIIEKINKKIDSNQPLTQRESDLANIEEFQNQKLLSDFTNTILYYFNFFIVGNILAIFQTRMQSADYSSKNNFKSTVKQFF